jgi:hypothetical protein
METGEPLGAEQAAALASLDQEGAFQVLTRWTGPVEWGALPTRVRLADGSRLAFEHRRRSVRIDGARGSVMVVDLGRRDRMRDAAAILTPGLVRRDGPTVELSAKERLGAPATAEVALRDPEDAKGKRAATFVTPGPHPVGVLVDEEGRAQLLAFGHLDDVSGFGTFLMDGGVAYACLRSRSGLAALYDAPRTGFLRAVTDEVVEQARAEGVAPVVTAAGCIGAVLDCGAPGEYLALAAYQRDTGRTVGVVVDLRRPPVRDGAIVDPVEV